MIYDDLLVKHRDFPELREIPRGYMAIYGSSWPRIGPDFSQQAPPDPPSRILRHQTCPQWCYWRWIQYIPILRVSRGYWKHFRRMGLKFYPFILNTFQDPPKKHIQLGLLNVSHVFRRIDPSTLPNIVFSTTTLIWVHIPQTYIGHLEIPFILGIIIRIFSWRPSEAYYGHFVGIFQDIPWYLAPRDLKKSWHLQSTAGLWLLMSCMIYETGTFLSCMIGNWWP